MHQFLKQKLKIYLAWITKKVIAKYNPKIVGITGSVGKTSVKEAVYVALNQKFRVRRSERNYNNEFGLPLAVIGAKSPEGSALGWLYVLAKGLSLVLFSQRYPEVLVLEMGIDRPNDMDYLLSLAKPNVAVVTTIGMSHYQFFSSLVEIEHEKGKIVEAVGPDGFVVLNADNEPALRQRSKTQSKVITYGRDVEATVSLDNLEENLTSKVSTRMTLKYQGESQELSIPAVGQTHVSAVLAGIAVAKALGVEQSLLGKGMLNYRPAPSRLNVIGGIKHSVIIDDSYNAAPDSMNEALSLLKRMPNDHKMAILGSMLELGGMSEEEHVKIGKLVAEIKPDHLITIGEEGKIIADSAKNSGMSPDKVLEFDTADEARKTAQNLLEPDSVILVKGSQGVRTEKIVKEIMAEPMRAGELVCRQYGAWLQN